MHPPTGKGKDDRQRQKAHRKVDRFSQITKHTIQIEHRHAHPCPGFDRHQSFRRGQVGPSRQHNPHHTNGQPGQRFSRPANQSSQTQKKGKCAQVSTTPIRLGLPTVRFSAGSHQLRGPESSTGGIGHRLPVFFQQVYQNSLNLTKILFFIIFTERKQPYPLRKIV